MVAQSLQRLRPEGPKFKASLGSLGNLGNPLTHRLKKKKKSLWM